ncbi:MAG: hypothetical protein MRK01_05995 [Candidatus Scalindua sp.]|nr:hypothetical protein [Candidatus Scalindua sp.]
MREGFKTIIELLQSNMEREEEREQLYKQCVMESVDSKVRQIFNHLARAAKGHKEAFKKVIQAIESEDHTVGLYCLVCGWAVDFGKSPSVGNEERCPLCAQKFVLVEKEDNFVLKPLPQ